MSSLNKGERWILRSFNTIKGNFPNLFIVAAGALLAIYPIGRESWMPGYLSFISHPWIFYLGLALYVIGALAFLFRKDSYGDLRENVRDLKAGNQKISRDLIAILQEQIRHLVIQLDLDTSNHRISLYRHAEGKFHLLSRHSRNPTYQAPGRSEYPDNQGLIGDCWTRGKAHVRDLPEDKTEWIDNATEKHRIPPKVSRQFKMRSRSLMGVRLDCGETRSVPTGIIIIESTEPRGMAIKLDDLVNSDMVDLLTRTLLVSIESLPRDGRDMIQEITSNSSSS